MRSNLSADERVTENVISCRISSYSLRNIATSILFKIFLFTICASNNVFFYCFWYKLSGSRPFASSVPLPPQPNAAKQCSLPNRTPSGGQAAESSPLASNSTRTAPSDHRPPPPPRRDRTASDTRPPSDNRSSVGSDSVYEALDELKESSNRDSGNGTCTESLPDEDPYYELPGESSASRWPSHEASLQSEFHQLHCVIDAAPPSFNCWSFGLYVERFLAPKCRKRRNGQ